MNYLLNKKFFFIMNKGMYEKFWNYRSPGDIKYKRYIKSIFVLESAKEQKEYLSELFKK